MQHVWLILKRDARGLRMELALLGVLAVLVAWTFTHFDDASWAALTAAVGANYVIARVIHADAVAGDAPFWITRPYPPRSMLLAKVLFLLLFIQLPMAAVDFYVIGAQGFSIGESLPGLFTFQALMFVCAVMPVAGVASLTSGLVQFLFAEVAALGLMFLVFGLTFLGNLRWIPMAQAGPPAVDWLRSSLAAAVVACVGTSVLVSQYTGRSLKRNRLIAAGGALTAAVLYIFLPWTAQLDLQTLISPGGPDGTHFDGTKISGALESVKKSVFPMRGRRAVASNEVNLPITLRGVPADDLLVVDALYLRLAARSGREWSMALIPVTVRPAEPGQALVNAEVVVDRGFFAGEASHPVSLHATLYLTLFGKPRGSTMPIRQAPTRVMDGLECSESSLIGFTCKSAFRWPRRLVSAESENSGASVSSLSYSPFPADLGSEPIEARLFSLPWTATEVTISSRMPVAHFQTDITIPDVILKNFTLAAKIRQEFPASISTFE